MKILFLSLAACASPGGASSSFDPTAVQAGTYALTATTQADNCTPARAIPSLTNPVSATADTIQAFVDESDPSGSSVSHFTLTAADGYSLRVPSTGEHIHPCPSVLDDSIVTTYTLTAADATSFDVDRDETWTVNAACPDLVYVDGEGMPSASCHASLSLHYARVGP